MEKYLEYINSALADLNFKELTPVQTEVIPQVLKGKSLVVQSVTGTGKTHAFLIPLFQKLDLTVNDLQAVIVAPTRELAKQIFDAAKQIASFCPEKIDIRLYVGGTNRELEIEKLKKSNPMICVATPGKLQDFAFKERVLNTYKASMFIIDEADMALDLGFIEEIDKTCTTLQEDTQMMVFSATVPEKLDPFLKKYLHNPEFIKMQPKEVSSLNIKHYFMKTKGRDKFELLDNLCHTINPYLAMIFCNTKEMCDKVYEYLKNKKYSVTVLHGGLESRKRSQVIKRIKNLDFTYIVSSDIAARGIDLEQVSHIINFELPKDIEFYIHRTGRTGRMLNDGEAISLYDFNDDNYLDLLEGKGLKTEYVSIFKGELVKSKARYAREKREFKDTEISQKAKKLVKHTDKTVKPGYKKKYNEELEKIKKQIRRKKRR